MTQIADQLRTPATPSHVAALRRRLAAMLRQAGIAALGILALLVLWQIAALLSGDALPGPIPTLQVLATMLRDPFYDNGPNDKGIGLQLLASLGRVFSGWGIGIAIAVPLGMLLGSSKLLADALGPVVEILRPVSPLAWYPLGLAVLHNAPKAIVFAIVITSLWPALINTAQGVRGIPSDLKAVARVFQFGRWRYLSKVLFPAAFPSILTGMRLSMGIAWMVIVAGEMLAGGTGIGFFVWDSWNALSLERVLSAVLVIGITGLLLDRLFALAGRTLAGWQEGDR